MCRRFTPTAGNYFWRRLSITNESRILVNLGKANEYCVLRCACAVRPRALHCDDVISPPPSWADRSMYVYRQQSDSSRHEVILYDVCSHTPSSRVAKSVSVMFRYLFSSFDFCYVFFSFCIASCGTVRIRLLYLTRVKTYAIAPIECEIAYLYLIDDELKAVADPGLTNGRGRKTRRHRS